MKRNIFKLFLNKILAYPLWIKQVVYYRMWQNMHENGCERYLIKNPNKILSLHIPTLTFKGKQELLDKKGGFDSNIYNFLKFSHNEYTLLEIALNMFLSVEEVSKLYLFCVEQNLIEKPEHKEILAMAEFISGKIRVGEYFLNIDSIDNDQLSAALIEQKNLDDIKKHVLFGQVLVKLGFITEETVKILFRLKSDAKKRFVINPDLFPQNNQSINDVEILEIENQKLRKENKILKNTIEEIRKTVKDYDI